jgi:single-strand DNA-binding protein
MADNMVTLVGSLGNEPELRTTQQGGEVLNFRLATNERKRNADGTWVDGPTSWFRVAVWGTLGRNALASLHKGQRVVVQGTLRIAEFTAESGGTTRTAEVKAHAIGHDLAFGTSAFTRNGQQETIQQPATGQAPSAQQVVPEARTLEPVGVGWGAQLAEEDTTPF